MQTEEEYHGFDNLMLPCRHHHKLVKSLLEIKDLREREMAGPSNSPTVFAPKCSSMILSPVGADVTFPAIQGALAEGGLQDVASLPGNAARLLQSLKEIWRVDIDLSSLPKGISRLAELHLIETRIRQGLPIARMLPRDVRLKLLGPVPLVRLMSVGTI